MKLLYPRSRDEWLKLRTGYISSTESAALFGQSPYFTAFEIGVMKKRAHEATTEDLVGTERMLWGQRLQDAIMSGVASDYGVQVEAMGTAYAVDDEARMGSSFDAKVVGHAIDPCWDPQDKSRRILREFHDRLGDGLLEIKNVDSLEYKNKWFDGEAPDHIEIQLQHQLECIGLGWGAIGVLVGGNRLSLIVRERDRKVGAIIRRRVSRFWSDFQAGKLPDPVMPDDASVLVALYNYSEPNKYFDGQEDAKLEEWAARYKGLGTNIAELKKEQEVAKANILGIIKDSERAQSAGYKISATMIAPTRIEAYDRAGYRDFRITQKKDKK